MNISLNYIFDKYYIILYYLQYSFSQLIVSDHQSSIWLLLMVFIFLGLLTILTPCFLSMLPLSMSYISYQSNSLSSFILFIAGLLTSLLCVVKLFNVVTLNNTSSKFSFLFSFLMTIISLDLMNIVNLSRLYSKLSSFVGVSHGSNIFFQKYLVGLIIGLSSLPCNTSILFIFNFLVSHIANTFILSLYIGAYLTGLIVPIVLIFSFNFYALGLSSLSTFWFLFNNFVGSLLFISSLLSCLRLLFN